MTNDVGKAIFSKAGELGVPVGFMCMKVCTNIEDDFLEDIILHSYDLVVKLFGNFLLGL